jgi:uncharacterized protein
MKLRKLSLVFLIVALCACKQEDDVDLSAGHLTETMEKLQFTCSKESDHLPVISDRAQRMYAYALFLNSALRDKDYGRIGRFYRLAYAAGSYKAAANLHTLISQGLVESSNADKEVIDIVEGLIKAGVPGGYYDMGHYLELGYGVKQDTSKANTYFRRAADLGNPDAQFYVSRLLETVKGAGKVVAAMRRCAMNQGHAKSGYRYGILFKVRDMYPEAVEGFQAGTRNGDGNSAAVLSEGFSTSDPTNGLYYFGLAEDPERASRYKQIATFLSKFEHLGPKIPDIDNIVPLPPAKLPDWDGTFEWKRKRDSTPPPEKPSEELILEIARENNLDPETGLSLPSGTQ